MKNLLYTTISIVLALIYWGIESTVHHLVFNEPVFELLPHETNELWMRSLIVVLFVLFGLYTDHHSRQLRKKEQDKLQLFRITVGATNHIINNYLQQMQLFKLEAERCPGFSDQVLGLFDDAMHNTQAEIRKLNAITELNASSVRAAIFPH